MQINGGINFCEPGMRSSIRAMQVQQNLLGIVNENIVGFDKVGFQRREPIVSSMTEYLGVHGVSTTIDDRVGRIVVSDNPLDIALNNKGYFQVLTPNGVKLTRDGRFKLDKEGNLLTLQDLPVLSDAGMPIKLPCLPDNIDKIRVDAKGKITVYDPSNNKLTDAGFIGIVDATGMAVLDPDVKQGYNEYSNVPIQQEFFKVKPIVNNFEANRQLFMIQNNNLSKVISQLGNAN